VRHSDRTGLPVDFSDRDAVARRGLIDVRVMGGVSSRRPRHDPAGHATSTAIVVLERYQDFASAAVGRDHAATPPWGSKQATAPPSTWAKDQPCNAACTSSSIFFASPNSMRLFSL
jgi:hypothetical protein